MLETLKKLLRLHEGYDNQPYVCPAGKWSIGYGYNYEDRGFDTETLTHILKHGFTKELAEELLDADAQNCVRELSFKYSWFAALDETRQIAVADMYYNMGEYKFSTFRKMISALSVLDYTEAAKEAKASKWYGQTGTRAVRIVNALKTGAIKWT